MATNIQLYSVEKDGPRLLSIPSDVNQVHEIFDPLPGGIYTALCTFEHNKFLHLEDHLDRLAGSMAGMGWDARLDRAQIRQALHQVCTAFPGRDSRIRLDILPNPAVHLGSDSHILIALSDFDPPPDHLYREGVRVGINRRLSRHQPLIKKAEFARQRRPFFESDPSNYEYLLVDQNGHLLEGATSSFYGIRNQVLFTAGQGVLEGIARKVVLRVAGELHVPVRFTPVHEKDTGRLDEAAMSSSSRAIIPIVQIDGRMVGDGQPGPITKRLLVAYRAYLAREIRTAVEE